MVRGLCIVPEGEHTKDCKFEGYPYEVSKILCLDEILEYSKRHFLGILYMMENTGIHFSDDIVKQSEVRITKYSKEKLDRWNLAISEEITRHCISNGVNTVYIMCKSYYKFNKLIKILRSKGISVYTPIRGCNINSAIKLLSL